MTICIVNGNSLQLFFVERPAAGSLPPALKKRKKSVNSLNPNNEKLWNKSNDGNAD
jgi:hypothetical protein